MRFRCSRSTATVAESSEIERRPRPVFGSPTETAGHLDDRLDHPCPAGGRGRDRSSGVRARAAPWRWFLIRKEPKGRGTNLWVEGARIKGGERVMLVDDVVTTGGSIKDAYKRVQAEGGQVVFATTLVDRSDSASAFFQGVKVPYRPMLTYRDLDIVPVAGDR